MNPFLKKEIRSLLPSFLAVLVLAATMPWFFNDPDFAWGFLPVLLFFGMIMVGVDCFGREFHAGTFPLLLAQPVERKRLWRTKLGVLAAAAVLIFIGYFASCEWRMHRVITDPNSVWHYNMKMFRDDFRGSMWASAVVTFVAMAGGLWTTLLFRQVATAFWITFLVPAGLGVLAILCLPSEMPNAAAAITFTIIGLAYSLAGFWLARKLFYRAQDVAWTGAVISFSRWKYFEGRTNDLAQRRRRAPLAALIRKEFALHSIALMGAGILLGLHLVVFIVRALYFDSHRNSTLTAISDFYWTLWLVMPLVIGCMAMAEERKLGVIDGQLCLPASRRRQFMVKFIPTMVFGIFLGGFAPILLETGAASIGNPDEVFINTMHQGGGLDWFEIAIIMIAGGFAVAGFFASSLARNFLQALSIAIIVIVGTVLSDLEINWLDRVHSKVFGVVLWHAVLPIALGTLIMPITLIWLSYTNFSRFQETNRMWRRNIRGVLCGLAVVFVSSTLIYHRAWECFESAEPTHGAARLSLSDPSKMNQCVNGGLTVRTPDGKIWVDYINMDTGGRYRTYGFGSQTVLFVHLLLNPMPRSQGPGQFLEGSNWSQALAEYDKMVGLKIDGTFWVQDESNRLIQVGIDTDWQAIGSYGQVNSPLYLLKTNHTLWEWFRPAFGRKLTRTGHQVGPDADWAEIFPGGMFFRKMDGTVWEITTGKADQKTFTRMPYLDELNFKTASLHWPILAYVREDGRLMIGFISTGRMNEPANDQPAGQPFVTCGNETNWVAAAVGPDALIALKADGTLWKWSLINREPITDVVQTSPVRLGIHNDWTALASSPWYGTYALAADGSLWLWPAGGFQSLVMQPRKRPEFIANILGKAD